MMTRAIESPGGGSGGVTIDVSVRCARWRRMVPKPAALVREAASAALVGARFRGAAELSVVLDDDAAVRALNARWRGKDAPTNVLAFASEEASAAPGSSAPRMLGDVVLALTTVAREAREQGKRLPDHLRHLVIHGVLHLLGYDHVAAAPARRMEALETRILAGLGVADPYRLREAADG